MSFLAPLFLLGAVAVVGPILLHLIRRTTRRRVPFSSLMFLGPTPPRVRRRSRLEHVFLLLLRCLVLGLLALAFARPLFQHARPIASVRSPSRSVVVLVDRSASMRRENLWAQAQEAVRNVLNDLPAADEAALCTFDRHVQPVVSFLQWNGRPASERVEQCLAPLRALGPGWAATDLGHALVGAAELLEETGAGLDANTPAAKQIVVVSDFAGGSRLAGLQGYEWPEGVEVVLRPVQVKRSTNAGLQPLSESDDDSGREPGSQGPRVRVSNVSESTRENFRVGWVRTGQSALPEAGVEVYVPAGASRVVALPEPSSGQAPSRLVLQGDDQEFDNTAYIVTAPPERLTIVYVGRESAGDPAEPFFYLERALQRTRRQELDLVLVPAAAVQATNRLEEAALVIVADVLSGAALERVRQLVVGGRTALFLLKTPAIALTLNSWPELGQVTCEEGQSAGYVLLAQIDFQHPLFLPFAEARYSDFTKIHFWKHRHLAVDRLPGARVLAAFENGAPALVEFRVGRGTLLVLTSGWHPVDSQLALSTKFVPLLYSLLQQSAGLKAEPSRFSVGDDVLLSVRFGSGPVRVVRPDGVGVDVVDPFRFAQTDLPGVYTASGAGWTQTFAVNLPWEESRTTPLPAEELEQLGVPLQAGRLSTAAVPRGQPAQMQAAEVESRQKLWRWLIVAALGVIFMETWLAGRLSRVGLDAAADVPAARETIRGQTRQQRQDRGQI